MPTKSSPSSLPLVGTHFSVDFGTTEFIKEHSFSEIDIPNLEFKTEGENTIITGQKEFYPDGFEFGDLVLKRGKTSKYIISCPSCLAHDAEAALPCEASEVIAAENIIYFIFPQA